MSKIIITQMDICQKTCTVCAEAEDQKIMEIRICPKGTESLLNNIYIGKVQSISSNIGAAFVLLPDGQNGYFPLSEQDSLIYASGRRGNGPLRPGDEILVQVCRDAMKGKLPALTSNLNFTGKYLVLTTGNKKIGMSSRLFKEDRERLAKWIREELVPDTTQYGLIVRTNAGEAAKQEIFAEFSYLKKQYEKVAVQGRNRTCFSLLLEGETFYLSAVRDIYTEKLEKIITDDKEIFEKTSAYLQDFSPEQSPVLEFYEDKLLPLYKLYRMESAIEEICKEKVWLNSGGFLVIQQTEAFVSIDVNSGKFTGKKKIQETYRKINLEAAKEIARQLRLRNLSGIILIDFINMENPDHQDELFHVLQKYLRQDHVKCKVIDITPLHILEMTRKKVRRPVIEDLKELK